MRISVVSGGFDPLHTGHINLLESAAAYGDKLIVLVNSDEWLTRKKGRPFMPFEERSTIIQRMDMVDNVYGVNDSDGSVTQGLIDVRNAFGHNHDYIFCNGGDRGKDNIPEMDVDGYDFKFSVGGDHKANSSSWILKEWQYPTERRVWGEFSDLFQDGVVRVKELVIEAGKGISYQRHFKRSEMWFISKGRLNVKHSFSTPDKFQVHTLEKDQFFHVKQGDYHQAYNPFDEPCHIIEIQYGEETTEDDIERLEYYDGE
jgi:D-beta-D-heptose 7-phosphate kinase/D-beta-D-heptose 1-phosphate adenosyltransferase